MAAVRVGPAPSSRQVSLRARPVTEVSVPTAALGPQAHAIVQALQGVWVNTKSQGERYTVTYLSVTRSGADGSIGQFTLHWDPQRRELQWGVNSNLRLEWLCDGLISWVSPGPACRDWRWQRPLHVYGAVAVPGQRAPTMVPPSSTPHRLLHPDELLRGGYGYAAPAPGALLGQRAGGTPGRAQPYQRAPAPQWAPQPSVRRFEYASPAPPRGRRRGSARGSRELACGLTHFEVSELLFREITPEDYEMLCRLDEKVEKKPAAANVCLEKLTRTVGESFLGEQCAVCQADFSTEDEVAGLPCQHHFHAACVQKWLSECKATCPLCGAAMDS